MNNPTIKGATTAPPTTKRYFIDKLFFDKLFFILALATPLVIIPRIFPSWEIGKIFWFLTVVEIWFWFRLVTCGLSLPKVLRPTILTLFLYLFLLLIESFFLGGNSFWGGYWRRQGWLFLAHLGVLFYLVSTSCLDQKFIIRALKIILTATVIVGFILSPTPQRYSGTLGEANSWGIFAALALILSVELKQSYLFFPVYFFGLLLSQSRSALASLVVLITRVSWPGKFIFIILTLAIFSWFNLVRGGGARLELWSSSFSLWQQHPWFGIGLDNFQTVFTKFMENKGLQWQYYDQPHNLILWLLVSSGAFGLGLFVGWIYSVFSQPGNILLKKLTIALLIFGLFQPFSTAVWVYFFVFMAFIIYQPRPQPANRIPPTGFLYRFWILVLGILVWWFVVGQLTGQYRP